MQSPDIQPQITQAEAPVPNLHERSGSKTKWLAAVGAGFLALGGLGAYGIINNNTEQADNTPKLEMNLDPNPFHLSAQEQMKVIEVREKECGGVFSPDSCWTIPGLNPRLLTQSMVKFTPRIPLPGSENYALTNDTFSTIKLYK